MSVYVRIEIDCGDGWRLRQEGDADMTIGELIDLLPAYCIRYPHRLFVDGTLVRECPVQRPARNSSK